MIDPNTVFQVRQRALSLAYSTAVVGEPFSDILRRAFAIETWLLAPFRDAPEEWAQIGEGQKATLQ